MNHCLWEILQFIKPGFTPVKPSEALESGAANNPKLNLKSCLFSQNAMLHSKILINY